MDALPSHSFPTEDDLYEQSLLDERTLAETNEG